MCDFKKDDLVVCVDAKPDKLDPLASKLVEGRYYRVGAVGVREDGETALAFPDMPSQPGRGWAFCIRRFRKIGPADSCFIERMSAARATQKVT